MARARLLIVDDEPAATQHVMHLLASTGFSMEAVRGGDEALSAAQDADDRGRPFDVILVDYHMPDIAGADVLRGLSERGIDSHVILMSGQEPPNLAVEAMKLGAFDFITKPLDRAELELRIARALRDRQSTAGGESPVRKLRKSDVIVGGSPAVKELFQRLDMVAPTDVTVALSGEPGTGKELLARTIHNLSKRYQRRFVAISCAAIPAHLLRAKLFGHERGTDPAMLDGRPGLLAAADGGTLFIDDIDALPLSVQSDLVTVLRTREVRREGARPETPAASFDARIITATSRDLDKAVASGEFRRDLLYRINVFPIAVPPLRERRGDIPLLAQHFLLIYRAKIGRPITGFSSEAMDRLVEHEFPGNVRELEHLVHRSLARATGELVEADDIPLGESLATGSASLDLSRPFRELKRELINGFEQRYVRRLLRAHGGNVSAAARHAGMPRTTLRSLIRKHGIDPGRFRDE
jgi:two-component system response regulator HydG